MDCLSLSCETAVSCLLGQVENSGTFQNKTPEAADKLVEGMDVNQRVSVTGNDFRSLRLGWGSTGTWYCSPDLPYCSYLSNGDGVMERHQHSSIIP